MTESQKSGALRAFITAAFLGTAVGGYLILGSSEPTNRLTWGHAWVDCAIPEAAVFTEKFDKTCVTGYWLTETCAPPDGPDAGALPESTPGLDRLSWMAQDRGPCGPNTYVKVYGPEEAPWEAACGTCEVKLPDGGWEPAPAYPNNLYFAPGEWRGTPDAGCYPRVHHELSGKDGTRRQCLPPEPDVDSP